MAARPPPTRPLVHFPKTLQPDARPKPAPGRPTEGVSRFRRRAAVRRGGWEIAVEDAVGEPLRAGDLLRMPSDECLGVCAKQVLTPNQSVRRRR